MKMTPKIFNVYKKVHEEEEQKKADLIDYEAWLNGMYVREAILSAFEKSAKYPKKPYSIIEREEALRNENPNKAAANDFAIYADVFNVARKSGEGSVE